MLRQGFLGFRVTVRVRVGLGVTADVPRHTRHVLRLDGDRVVPLDTGCVLADVCLTKGYCWGLVEVCVPLSALIKKMRARRGCLPAVQSKSV